MEKKIKIIILTDSLGNPRSFPIETAVSLEQTYPYKIREMFSDATVWQLSYGNISTEELTNQAIGYLHDWDPDFVIIQSGINDCRPEAMTEFQKLILSKFTGPLFRFLKKHVHNPRLIKRRQIRRISKRSYKKTLNKFKMIFNNSKIFVVEICAANDYEKARPGVRKRIMEYNELITQIYNDDVVLVQDQLNISKGFNADNLHLNLEGHRLVTLALADKIKKHLND